MRNTVGRLAAPRRPWLAGSRLRPVTPRWRGARRTRDPDDNTRAQVLHRWALILSAMDSSDNRLEDFPAATFALLAFCDACGHQAPLDGTHVQIS